MNDVKIGLKEMSIADKIQFARQIVSEMTGNPNFATPAPGLPALTAAAAALESAFNDAQTARQMAKSKTAAQDAKDAALDLLLTQESKYVESTSAGDIYKIESSGFSRRNARAPIGQLPAPTNLQVTAADRAGTLNLRWGGVRGAHTYIIERAADSTEPLAWTSVAGLTKRKGTVNGMVSGQKYWLRVVAIGSAGQGAWSNAVAKFAP